jgi:hypothetical protein
VRDLEKARRELQRALPVLQERIQKLNSDTVSMFDNSAAKLKRDIAILKERESKLISELKMFGTYINDRPVLDLNFTLGNVKNIIEQKYKTKLQNAVFNINTPGMLDYIKLYVCNLLLGVKEKYAVLTIYDPENQGMEFAEILHRDTADYIKVYTESFGDLFKKLRAYSQESVLLFGKKTIQDYNEECCKVHKITRDYHIVVIMSDTEKVIKTPNFQKFLEYSANTGVIFVVCVKGETADIPNTAFYNAPYTLANGEKIQYPYKVTASLLPSCASTYLKAVTDGKTDVFPYKEVFRNRNIPKETYWTESTLKGIGLNFGLEQGDPDKGYTIQLGDGNVHALMVGATGAGKSAALNQMLLSLILRYSPKELELILVDFKRAEFETLADPVTKRSRIPHAKILAGTTDGEYSLSVFRYLQEEMRRRFRLFGEVQVKKLEDYNNKMICRGTPERKLPRILAVIDEFQVMFTETDAKTAELVSKSITSVSKLARAAGTHFWFTSQSMQGTLSKDILDQFSLRAALRCAPDTQQAIIGSGKLYYKTKVGWIWTNEHGGSEQSSTKLWKIPYADNSVIEETLKICGELCIKHNIKSHNALFYDEEKKYTSETLFNLYEEHSEIKESSRSMFIGERTSFSLNNAPINFNLTADDGENVFVLAAVPEDFFNLCLTFTDNIRAKSDSMLLIHSSGKETLSVLDAENLVAEEFREMCLPEYEFSNWIDVLEQLTGVRKEDAEMRKSPVYILAVQWEKYRGVGRNAGKDFERFKRILQDAPSMGVHFIFISRTLQDFPREILMNCNHRICAKTEETESQRVIDSGKAAKIAENGFAIYRVAGEDSKFKIYQHKFSREFSEREMKF